jgi:hypothetical protein
MASSNPYSLNSLSPKKAYELIFNVMGGRTSEELPLEEGLALWRNVLKKREPVSSDLSQSSGIYNQRYDVEGMFYDALWSPSESVKSPPGCVVKLLPMEEPGVREARLEKERLSARVGLKERATPSNPNAL